MEIRITQTKDGRYFAQYINKNDCGACGMSGIGQFGISEEDAKLNLDALLIAVTKERNKKFIKCILYSGAVS